MKSVKRSTTSSGKSHGNNKDGVGLWASRGASIASGRWCKLAYRQCGLVIPYVGEGETWTGPQVTYWTMITKLHSHKNRKIQKYLSKLKKKLCLLQYNDVDSWYRLRRQLISPEKASLLFRDTLKTTARFIYVRDSTIRSGEQPQAISCHQNAAGFPEDRYQTGYGNAIIRKHDATVWD